METAQDILFVLKDMFKDALQEMVNSKLKIVPKNKRYVSGPEDKIISLYGRGLTTREINEQIQYNH